MLKEFRAFAVRGNVIDLAVAVIIGGAFGKIVGSLVNDVIMPLVGVLMGGINLAEESLEIGAAVVKWGAFAQTIVDFVIIAFVIFLIIKAANKAKKEESAPVPTEPTSKKCPFCLTEIAIKASRCPNCTSQL